MKKAIILRGIQTALAALLIATLTASQASRLQAAARTVTPPYSYLHYKVYSVDQLVAQVEQSPRIRDAYARTLHMPADQVVDYMRHNVVESYIPTTKEYSVYCVTPSGHVFTIHQVFRQGTKVFALRNGQPVFKWVCGNPLMSHLPTVATRTKTLQSPPKVVTKISPSVETLIPNQPAAEIIPSESVAMLPTAPVVTTSAAGFTAITGSGGFPFWLPLLPIGLIHNNSSSGSTATAATTSTTTAGPTETSTTTTGPTETSTTTTGPTQTTTTGPTTETTSATENTSTTGTVVPEPSSATSIGIGFVPLILALLFSVTRKRRKAS